MAETPEIPLSRKAGTVTPSLTLEIAAQARRLLAEGHEVIAFAAGEPDLGVPEEVARTALLRTAHKLPVRCRFVRRRMRV